MTTEKRTSSISIWFTSREFECLNTRWHQSICRKRSEYIRKLLLGKPVTIRHRNQSLDDLMAILIPLRAELNSISQNYKHEAAWEAIQLKITEIKSIISHIDDVWLQ